MGGKKPTPEAIPLEQLVREHMKLPKHRRELNREAQRDAISADGTTRLHDDELLTVVEIGLDHRDAQTKRARKPRGKGDDGRTSGQVVADVVKGQPADLTPAKLLPRVHAALEANGNRGISDKRAKELIRSARRRRT